MDSAIALQVGVKVLLKNSDGNYLLLRRSLEKYPDIQGRWDIAGGRIEPGIALIENLKREVKEETGLELLGEPKLIAAQDILRNRGKHIVRLTYVGNADGVVVIDVNEHDQYKWYSQNELMALRDLDMYVKELLNNNENKRWFEK